MEILTDSWIGFGMTECIQRKECHYQSCHIKVDEPLHWAKAISLARIGALTALIPIPDSNT